MSGLSVIIPTLNEERNVGCLLSDIAAQTREPEEVIVVDAASEDDTLKVARRFSFVRVLEDEPPVARERNLGGTSAAGEILVFLDATSGSPRGSSMAFSGSSSAAGSMSPAPSTSPTALPGLSRVSTRSSTRCSGSFRVFFLLALDTT